MMNTTRLHMHATVSETRPFASDDRRGPGPTGQGQQVDLAPISSSWIKSTKISVGALLRCAGVLSAFLTAQPRHPWVRQWMENR